ncbi:MAG TPA: histidine--tRNA ligase [Alphaproteobacteria bacterium]
MASLQPVRGTRDILPAEARRMRHVVETGRTVAERYGFDEIATPIFESSAVFKRTLGETSDIVTKEMYTFTDKGGEEITLRPEGTAGVVRALISGGLTQDLPLKFFYAGPMFRYERPQKGRLRQFHQIGVELLGVAEPIADIETIAVGAAVLDALGVLAKTTLELNSLGNQASRAAYRAKLVDYLTDHEARLSTDSKMRLKLNPLRILDSKDEGDRRIIHGAPQFGESLDAESHEFLKQVTAGLRALGIHYVLNDRLVRGLDYYCHTAFEFTTQALGAQGTVLAGGRYDGLIAQMGGSAVPGVGWAAGVERLAMLIDDAPAALRPIAIVAADDAAETPALILAEELRKQGFRVELPHRGNMGRKLKRASKVNARAAVILGSTELAADSATLRDLDSGEQSAIPRAELAARLAAYR